MNHELEKLLGGFAADTLTPEEQQQLYRAALQDQSLFNALTDEQALKELLADPVVRRRLLETLQATQATSAVEAASWFNWFRRPAGLAWAGGLAGAVLAVVLGTQVYQKSLRQEAQLTAKEEAQPPAPSGPVPTPSKPAAPPATESSATSEQESRSSLPPRTDASTGKISSQAPRLHPTSDERRTRPLERDAPVLHAEAETVQKQIESSTEPLSKAASNISSSAPPSIASASPPSHPASTSPQTQSEVDSTIAPQKRASSLSARSLFYGAGPQGQDKSMALDTRRRDKAASESTQLPDQSTSTTQSLAMAKSKRASPLQPVGLRYSLSHTEQSEHFQDGATETAMPEVPQELTVESNQDGHLQVWRQVGDSHPQLLFPITETEQPRSKLTAHTPLTISVPSTTGMLIIRFSRTDRVPSATFDRTLLDDSTQRPLQESVLTDEPSGLLPPIHYIVNQDPALSEIVVQVSPSQP